jgi:non-homologous end joining protein Ku
MSMKAARAATSGAQFTFLGVITLVADVLPVVRPEPKLDTKMVSPALPDPTPLKQQYVVEGRSDLEPCTQQTARRAIELDDKTLTFVTPEEIEELRSPDVPEGECEFKVFPASDVDAVTTAIGAFRLRPTKMVAGSKAQQTYAMLVELVADAAQRDVPLVFIGEITFRDTQRMVRCEARDGNLVLVHLSRPGEMYDPVIVPLDFDLKNLSMASQLVDLQTEKFDPEVYRSTALERAESFKAELAKVGKRDLPMPDLVESADNADDLLAALTASVEAASKPVKKPAKAAAKKAPAKRRAKVAA